MPELKSDITELTTGDGSVQRLIHLKGAKGSKGPLLLVPGVGTGSRIFMPPHQASLPEALEEAGYDVWLQDWRPDALRPWTLDHVAYYDMPQAVHYVANETQRPIKVVAHCIGAIAIAMASVAGLIPQASTIVTNAVSLHPLIPRLTYLRMRTLLPMSGAFPAFLDPQWGHSSQKGWWPTIFRIVARHAVSTPCREDVCKMICWLYGEVWKHTKVSAETHQWMLGKYSKVPVLFFQHIGKCIRQGHIIRMGQQAIFSIFDELLKHSPKTEARFVFISGLSNQCFLPESQQLTYQWMQQHSSRKDHFFRLFPTYGHLDMFVGQQANREIFPTIIEQLEK